MRAFLRWLIKPNTIQFQSDATSLRLLMLSTSKRDEQEYAKRPQANGSYKGSGQAAQHDELYTKCTES
ncbi:hypothetical protein V6N13_067382 [Hibiscus sabdariffa]